VPSTVATEIIRARAAGGGNLRVDPARAACCALLLEHAALLETSAAELRRMEVLLASAPDPASARRETHRVSATVDRTRRALDRLGRTLAHELANAGPPGGPAHPPQPVRRSPYWAS
jgi:hypothetical protein